MLVIGKKEGIIVNTKREELIKIIERAIEIEKCFEVVGGTGIPKCRVLRGTEFEEWKADIKGLILSLNQNKLTNSILETIDGFTGWNDEKDFEKLKAELKTIYNNFEEYEKRSRLHPGFMFEEFCYRLFKLYNIQVESTATFDSGYDFLISAEDGQKYYTEVKYYKSSRVNKATIKRSALRLKNGIGLESGYKYLLIIASDLDDTIKVSIKNEFDIEVLDISNILFLVQDNEFLSKEIGVLMNDTVIDWTSVVPKENKNLAQLFHKKQIEIDYADISYNSDNLIEQFRELETGRDFSKVYEELCTKALKYLFEEYLAGWIEQNNTVDGLHRMDLICRIKRGNEFWDFVKEDLKSRYILFEFKNYREQIKQTQVYTTEKYLYKTALRTVCFLISRKGASENAVKAISGILRESGKLIIPLSDKDMINLLNCKKSGSLPEDYLSNILDELLMKLPK